MFEKDFRHLLNDESFLNYCFGRNDADVRYWNKWIDNHPEYAHQTEDLRRIIIMMAKVSQEKLRDQHFNELEQRIAGYPAVAVNKKPFGISSLAAAAMLLIVAAAGLLYHQHNKQVKNNVVARKQEIRPGSNKAILTLANGKKVVLTDSTSGEIAMQAGIKITKTAKGQIIYEMPAGIVTSNRIPEYNTIEAPTGGQWEVVLPDRSKVWLNARSSLTYPTWFAGNERKVKLRGEAYFEIAHNQKMPFRVVSKTQTVEVLGTHFNIMAYEDEQMMKTTLLEGSVKISDGNRARILLPGEQAQVQVSNATLKVTNDIDLEDVIAWKSGYFKFNESLESIMRKISRWYDVEISYAGKIDPSQRFGGKISRNKNLSSALKIMELTGNVHFKVQGRRVTVMQ